MATNRFSAELGRSAGSVDQRGHPLGRRRRAGIGGRVPARSALAGAAGDARSRRWRAIRRSTASRLSFTLGGPLRRQTRVRVRRAGGAESGRRRARRHSRHGHPDHPAHVRGGAARRSPRHGPRWTGAPAAGDDVMVRYSGQREDDISASAVDRAIGTASQRQQSENRLHAVLGSWTRVLSSARGQFAERQLQRLRQQHRAGRAGRAADVSEPAGGFVVPRAAGDDPEALAVRRRAVAGAGNAPVEVRRPAAARGRAVRPRRVPRRPHRAGRGFSRVRSQRRRPRQRRRPAVRRDAAERQARSGSGDSGCRQRASGRLRPGRLAGPSAAVAEPRGSLRDRHRREQRQPGRRAESDRVGRS